MDPIRPVPGHGPETETDLYLRPRTAHCLIGTTMTPSPEHHPLDGLLARTVRGDAAMRLRPGLLDGIRSAGREAIQAARPEAHRWIRDLAGAVGEYVRGALAIDQVSGAAVGFRSSSGIRQRVFTATDAGGRRFELDLETEPGADGQVVVRGQCLRAGSACAGARIALRDGGGARIAATADADGAFTLQCAGPGVELAVLTEDGALGCGAIDVP